MCRVLTVVLAASLAAGCSTPQADAATDACGAAVAASLVGKLRSPELEAKAGQMNARTVRWIAPGDMVTRDYRLDRLNIDVDGSGFVTRVYCG